MALHQNDSLTKMCLPRVSDLVGKSTEKLMVGKAPHLSR